MNINEFIKYAHQPNDRFIPMVICHDGFSISIQASSGHYCEPRENNSTYYSKLELGYPSALPTKSIFNRAEDRNNYLDTVYGYVPVEDVDELLNIHGGIDIVKTMNQHIKGSK